MTDYTDIDGMIVRKIQRGARTFAAIDGGEVYNEANRLHELTGSPAFRIIDRRLQALRKKGVIQYTTSEKWQAVK